MYVTATCVYRVSGFLYFSAVLPRERAIREDAHRCVPEETLRCFVDKRQCKTVLADDNAQATDARRCPGSQKWRRR